MTLFHWRENMSVGVETLDADHKKLIDLLNRLHYMALAGADRDSIADLLDELVRQAEYHFRNEEILMRFHKFPECEAHRTLHGEVLRELDEVRDRFVEAPESVRIDDLYDFFADWLLVHMMSEDIKYKPYLSGHASAYAG